MGLARGCLRGWPFWVGCLLSGSYFLLGGCALSCSYICGGIGVLLCCVVVARWVFCGKSLLVVLVGSGELSLYYLCVFFGFGLGVPGWSCYVVSAMLVLVSWHFWCDLDGFCCGMSRAALVGIVTMGLLIGLAAVTGILVRWWALLVFEAFGMGIFILGVGTALGSVVCIVFGCL